jgi:uncharacterized membrane protein YfcA
MNPPLLVLIGIGLCAGVLSGVFGIGGGVVLVPALIYLAGFSATHGDGYEPRRAAAASRCRCRSHQEAHRSLAQLMLA